MTYILEDEFGDIIAKARTGLGLSQKQLSQRTDINVAAIDAMESYTREPTAQEIENLAQALDLNGPNLLAIAQESWQPRPWDQEHDPDAEVLRWQMPVGAYSVYCYLLRCRHTGESAVVDTGGQGQRVIAHLREQGITPRYILVTHEHSDHIGGIGQLQEAVGAKVFAGEAANVPDSEKLSEGDALPLGNLEVEVINTPGHTAGCVTYRTGRTAFVGDTLFAGSAGRANHSYEAILASIHDKLFALDGDVHLFPGHGPVTTVDQEKEHNPFVRNL